MRIRKVKRIHRKSRCYLRGFSLLELLIVIAIVGVLFAIAIPSYTAYKIRSNRADAQDKLTEIMFQMERFRKSNRTYTLDFGDLGYSSGSLTVIASNEGMYQINAQVCSNTVPLSRCVQLVATPSSGSPQVGDGDIALLSTGNKTFNGQNGW